MLIYSTRFRVVPAFDKKHFISTIIEWNRKSHSPINDHNTIDEIDENTFSFIAGEDDNYLEVTDLEEKSVIAARVHIVNNGGVWNTDVVLNYEENVISIYVNRNVGENTFNPSANAFVPQIVTLIIDNGYADKSMGIPIVNTEVKMNNKKSILDTIRSFDRFSLPMVYLSSRSELNAKNLAAKLSGLALVVADNSDSIADEYPEPIYVFFPHRNMTPVAFGNYPLHRDIQSCIVNYLNGREYRKLETWDGIQNEKTNINNRNLLNRYRDASSENTVLTEMYYELEEKMVEESQLRDKLSYENNMLIAENARLIQENRRLANGDAPLIMRGTEADLYENEQYELIIDILKDYLKKSVEKDTRRAHIIRSVIDANPAHGTPERFRKIIRNAFEGYKNFETTKILNALKETGIEIVNHTGHYKIALGGDNRYTCEAAATCSDNRGGLNFVNIVNNKMF